MTPDRCPEHLTRLPCAGCRADQLGDDADRARNLARQGVPPARVREILATALPRVTGNEGES